MLADSKYCFTFVVLSTNTRACVPDPKGNFFALKDKDTALPRRSSNGSGSPGKGLSRGRGGIPLLNPATNLNAMLKNLPPSESSPQPIRAQSIIDKLLLTDNLDDLRHRLSRDFMLLLAEEPDELERNRMLSDFNTLDMILETIEKER